MDRIERGFDFLGYHFSPTGVTLATKTITNFITKALRLYEQKPPDLRSKRLEEFSKRWYGWVVSYPGVYLLYNGQDLTRQSLHQGIM